MPQPLQAGAARRELSARLRRSRFFQDYVEAFEATTGLSLALRPPDSLTLVHEGNSLQNPFCVLMTSSNKSCSACLELQRRVEEAATLETRTLTCFAGLCESSVPVRVGDNVIAFLQVGQVLLHQPTRSQFSRTARLLLRWGAEVDLKRAEETYFHTRVIGRRQYEAVLRLLGIFAQHLSVASNQLMLAAERPGSPVIEKAKLYIAGHIDEEMSLVQVARAVNTSTFFFCKMFRRATGLHFLDYIARIRVERAKNFLLNPHVRISEAAFAAGFHSLSQFNRVFKRIVGEQPRIWRAKIAR